MQSRTEAEQASFNEVAPYYQLAGRSLGVTAGKRVCSVAYAAAEGDYIALFPGADRFFALLPVGDKYKLVGDAFVDRLKFGEAHEDADPSQVYHPIELI